MKPRIGVTSRYATEEWVKRNVQRYLDSVRAAGGEPVVLAPETHTVAVLDTLDGLLLSGGGDVDPSRYGETLNGSDADDIDPARDELEFALAQGALERDMPVLGVCRGFQVLNVIFGGKLVQDVPGHRGEPLEDGRRADVAQAVEVAPGTHLHEVLGETASTVNSFHHQAVVEACLGDGLIVSARHGELVEAFESQKHRWLVGVQWHPERYMLDHEVFSSADSQARLFTDFIAAARAWRGVPA